MTSSLVQCPVKEARRLSEYHDRSITYIVPDRHYQNHALIQSLSHLSKAALDREVVSVAKGCLLGRAIRSIDLVAAGASNGRYRVGNKLAVLNVVSFNGLETTGGALDELRNYAELLGRVDSHALPVEVLYTLTVRVEVAAIGIAVSGVASARVRASTSITRAGMLADGLARVGSESRGDLVGFPNVHLGAA